MLPKRFSRIEEELMIVFIKIIIGSTTKNPDTNSFKINEISKGEGILESGNVEYLKNPIIPISEDLTRNGVYRPPNSSEILIAGMNLTPRLNEIKRMFTIAEIFIFLQIH